MLLGGSALAYVLYGLALDCHAARRSAQYPSIWELIAANLGVTLVAALVPFPGGGTAVSSVGLSGALVALGVPETAAVGAVLVHQVLSQYLPGGAGLAGSAVAGRARGAVETGTKMSEQPEQNTAQEQSKKRVSWAELFFDLVFVFAVTEVSTRLTEDHRGLGLLRSLVLFVPVFWVWVGTSLQANLRDISRPALRLSLFGWRRCCPPLPRSPYWQRFSPSSTRSSTPASSAWGRSGKHGWLRWSCNVPFPAAGLAHLCSRWP